MYILEVSRRWYGEKPLRYKYQTLNEVVRAAFQMGQDNPYPDDDMQNPIVLKEDITVYQEGNDE